MLRVGVAAGLAYGLLGFLTTRLSLSPALADPIRTQPVVEASGTVRATWSEARVPTGRLRTLECPGPDPRCRAAGTLPGPELLGVSSVHTGRSGDARGGMGAVGRSARKAGLDFVLLGDHAGDWLGEPDAFTPRREAGVLLVPGQELVVDGVGRTLAIGLDTVVGRWSGSVASLSEHAHRAGGFVAVVHPRSPRSRERWTGIEAPGIHGWEALDVSETARIRLNERWAAYHLSSFLTGLVGGWAHESVLRLNREGLRAPGLLAYDSARARAPLTLLAALNHHPKAEVGRILFPDYTPFFRTHVNHVTVAGIPGVDPASDRRLVLEGLRGGRVFVSLGSAQEARGFRVVGWDGGMHVETGSAIEWTPASELVVRTPPAARHGVLIRVLRDGVEELWGRARPGETVAVEVHRPGVWRVEVYRAGVPLGPVRFNLRPWLLSNPVEFLPAVGDRLAAR